MTSPAGGPRPAARCIIQVPWGDEQLSLALPPDWGPPDILEPTRLPAVADPAAEVERALSEPIGSPRLGALVDATSRIALVVDDASRPTPVACMLPPVLEELKRGGVPLANVRVVTALGVHRPMTAPELAQRIGRNGLDGLHWENHDCDDPARLVHVGTTQRGTPVWVNRTVAESDVVVSIGCIEPHVIASFGGGYKNLIPGAAGRATIAHNHALNCSPGTFAMAGQPIERNPMRLDIEEAGRMLSPKVFIANAVLDSAQRIVAVVAGDPVTAHRAGARTSAGLYGVALRQPADVVIANSHPMDQDLRQGVKALANTLCAMRPGGVHITLVRAAEGVGVFGLAGRRMPFGRGALRFLAPALLRLVPRLRLQGIGEEDRFFLYFALQAMRRGRLLLSAPTVPVQVRGALPFVEFVESPDEAIVQAQRRFPGHARVVVFPHGGITYPILA